MQVSATQILSLDLNPKTMEQAFSALNDHIGKHNRLKSILSSQYERIETFELCGTGNFGVPSTRRISSHRISTRRNIVDLFIALTFLFF